MTDAPRPDILYLTHRVPYPPDKGDRIRTFYVLEFLRRRANVHLACLADEPVTEETRRALADRTARLSIVPHTSPLKWGRSLWSLATGGTVSEGAFASPRLTAVLNDWTATTRYHAVLASASSLAGYLRHPDLRQVPQAVDLTDVDSQKWLDYAAAVRGPKRWLYQLEGRRLRALEQRLARETNGLMLTTDIEVELFRQFCADGDVRAAFNGVNLDYFQPDPGGGEDATCAFVGALDYFPNVDAALWFCNEVWPAVHREFPRGRVLLIGRKPTSEVVALGSKPGIEVVGQVPDVRPHMARACVTVVPLRIARGIQNKVLESLAASKATVVTPQALGGLRTRPGHDLLVATSAAEWVDTLVSLFRAPERRQQLGLAGRQYVEQAHRWDTCLQPFAAMLGLPG